MMDRYVSCINVTFDQYVIDGLVVMGQRTEFSSEGRSGRAIHQIKIAMFRKDSYGIRRRYGIEITCDDGEIANAVVRGKICNDLCLGSAHSFPAVVEMGIDHGKDHIIFLVLQYGKNGNAWKDGCKKTAAWLVWCFGQPVCASI